MAIKCSSALNYTNVDNPFYCFLRENRETNAKHASFLKLIIFLLRNLPFYLFV